MNNKVVVYIAGYGRSGSTLLERILSSHEKIFGTRELANFLDLLESQYLFCSCGAPIQECEFWSDVIKNFGGDFGNIFELKAAQNQFESFLGFLGYIFGDSPDKRAIYRNFSQKFFSSISQKLLNEITYIVQTKK